MRHFERPRILISQCIEFDHCRWNGLKISSDVVKLLKPHVEFLPVCAEVSIGLGIPREPIRLVQHDAGILLYQPATDTYWTDQMERFAHEHLDIVGELDGAILKNRSPSCGIKDVRVYPANPKAMPENKGVGVFARCLQERLPLLALEDEGRLTNYRIREHFLTRIFVSAQFRRTRQEGTLNALVRFQAQNKFLLMAYSETAMRALGRIVANHDHLPATQVLDDYQAELHTAFEAAARPTASINVLQHVFGFFSRDLSGAEKTFFLDCLDDFRQGRVPLSVPISILRAWVERFDQEYLRDQSLFEPYPEDLVQITDSGKGRSF